MNKSHHHALMPTSDEIRQDRFQWEYAQDSVDVTMLGDPSNSTLPIINIRRRIIGQWEFVDGATDDQA